MKLLACASLFIAVCAVPASAQRLTIDDVERIIRTVHDAERMSWGASSTRESRNRDWSRIIGIVHHGHPTYNPTPDPQWCLKDAGNGRAQSDDVVVRCQSREFWDCVPSAGANTYSIRCSGHGADRLPPEQNVYPPPVPAGGGGATPPVVTPPVTPAPVNLAPVLDAVRDLRAQVDAIAGQVERARAEAEQAKILASDVKHIDIPALRALIESMAIGDCFVGRVPTLFGRSADVRFCREGR